MEIALIVLLVYLLSIVFMYGHIYRIMEKHEGYQYGELIARNICLAVIWPLWLPFYWSFWYWRS